MKSISSEADMLALGAKLANAVAAGAVIFLSGPLGAGKTTFVRGFMRGLGYQEKVKSPTYTLVEPYEIAARSVYHFDFYRLKTPEELQQIGLHEYFTPNAICLVEWPEKGFPLLPAPDVTCYIEFKHSERELRFEAHSTLGDAILKKL